MKLPYLASTVLAVAAMVCIVVPIRSAAKTIQATADADATSFPEPPMQKKPWTLPATNLPKAVVSAIVELYAQGLADPRGCEYREVEIRGDMQDGDPKLKVHAWVLPGESKQRYAVGWNGRVNRVESVGALVDLQGDFSTASQSTGMFNGSAAGLSDTMWETQNYGRKNARTYQYGSLTEKSVVPLKMALLLRLGEEKLAEKVLRKCRDFEDDPYLLMAREWLLSWHRHGIALRDAGDDGAALQVFRTLLPLLKAAEATAAQRRLAKSYGDKFYIEELAMLPQLIADEERRVHEGARTSVLKLAAPPAEKSTRIAALIRDLELVKGVQLTMPGSVEVNYDPVVVALAREGDDAVEPLLQCMENDMRLTRTPSIPVYEPAYIALVGILKTPLDAPLPAGKVPRDLTLDERKSLTAKLRAYWEKQKVMSPPERWFSTLQDDKATPKEWFQAAHNIVEAANNLSTFGLVFHGIRTIRISGSKPEPMQGESLRGKSEPSVSDLLVQRSNQLLARAGADKSITLEDMGGLLSDLADWDGKARIDDLRSLMREFNVKFAGVKGGFDSPALITTTLYGKRLAAGDTTALAEYAEWIPSLKPADLSFTREADPFLIMWEHPSDSAILIAAGKMFGGRDAPWRARDENGIGYLLNTPMLGIPVFREQVLSGLDDTTVIGEARHYENGASEDGDFIHMKDGSPWEPGPNPPPRVDIRVCDYYARQLAKAENFPAYHLTWPLEKRNTALVATRAFLKRYGDVFRFGPQDEEFYHPYDGNAHARLAFPRLDHPATQQDVTRNRAIFSLQGKVRLCPMPAFPLRASRPGSPQDVEESWSILPDGKPKKETRATTAGTVWQAEEVMVGGKWQRYYGFSGRHQLEKVPAAEIEFPSGFSWTAVAPHLDATMESRIVDRKRIVAYNFYSIASPAPPLVFAIKIRNNNGLDQQVPQTFTDASGITVVLRYSAKIPPAAQQSSKEWNRDLTHFDFGEWKNLPILKKFDTERGETINPLLGAAAELNLLQFDPRDHFDISRPGTYRLKTTFLAADGHTTNLEEITFSMVEENH